ncbi:MAG: oligosaccharide flippase family protein [Pyrinomonadaceae bacterium]|nr:oligosaccharide flippase family protein [Pyrinomonadaceae bacterium]MBP6213374.1 oligosaccharide flippase family protein [Pyrinomonadaceae bacterium]
MNQTKINILSNFAGRSFIAILSIVFVPIYLHYLSVEMYGIIGFFASIQAFLFLLDGGISPTLNREVARLTAFPEKAQELRDLSRTLEVLCWALAIVVCSIALVAAPAAANYWLRSETISPAIISEALMIMSVAFAFQWSVGFYTGGMYGLQEQKYLNIINGFVAVIRSVGSFVVLAFVSPTIKAFLIWQLIAAVLNCVLLGVVFWKKLPSSVDKPRFRSSLLRDVWRYAAGMAGTSLVVLVLTQTDKLILSKMLTLEDFGYYSLAITLAGTSIGLIVGSIQTTYFPQFSQLVAQERFDELRELYHRACQVMSFFLIPVVSIIAFFSYEILLVWTRKPEIAEKTWILLTLVAIGTGLNGLMHLPYYAQLAFGITKIGLWQNIFAVVFLIPLMIYGTTHYGAVGGAMGWVILNFSYTIVGLQVMHRMILKGELKKWYLSDVGLPLILAVAVNGVAYFMFTRGLPVFTSSAQTVIIITITFSLTVLTSSFSIPTIRHFVIRRVLGV